MKTANSGHPERYTAKHVVSRHEADKTHSQLNFSDGLSSITFMSTGMVIQQPAIMPTTQDKRDDGGGGGGGGFGRGGARGAAEGRLALTVTWPGINPPTIAEFSFLLFSLQASAELVSEVTGEPSLLRIDIVRHPNMALSLSGHKGILSAIGGLILSGAGAYGIAHLVTAPKDVATEIERGNQSEKNRGIAIAYNDEIRAAFLQQLEQIRHIKSPKRRLAELQKMKKSMDSLWQSIPPLTLIEFHGLFDKAEGEK
jgi:hypothetical protein